MAYLTTYQPGQADDSALFDKLTEVVGRELADFERANIRQLFMNQVKCCIYSRVEAARGAR